MSEREIWLRDPAAAVAEDFGDEVIVMNPTSGAFYSLRGRAADLWRGCAEGADVAVIESMVSQHDAAEAGLMTDMLTEFRSTGVLSTGPSARPADERVIVLGDEPAQFTKNEDFNDLIRLDPIHDVDDRGWPFQN